jgi:hypothetical protein
MICARCPPGSCGVKLSDAEILSAREAFALAGTALASRRSDPTDRAAAETSKEIDGAATSATKVIIYYKDDHGQKVAHYFKKIS